MEMKNPFGAPVRTRRFSHSTRLPSIRYATVLGGLRAFALLWAVSMRANADVPSVRTATPRALVAEAARPAAALAARDASGQGVPPGKGVHFQNQVAALKLKASSGSEAGDSPARLAAGSREVDTTSPCWLVGALVSACLVIIILVGTCCSRIALKRAASQERNRVLATVRHFAVAPLTAVSGLLEAFDATALSHAQRLSIGVIRSAVRTLARALDDVFEPAPLATHAVILDESVTDLRELIDGAVALFASSAAHRGVRVSVSIDQSVAARVLADSARLGQIVFHLLSRAVQLSQHGQITVTARAQMLNAASQRVFISVRDLGADAASSVQAMLPARFGVDTRTDEPHGDQDSGFALCDLLAQRMRGDLRVTSEPGFGTCTIFSAPFSIEPSSLSTETSEPAQFNDDPFNRAPAVQPAQDPAHVSPEPFERRYLDALAQEGIDLNTFLHGWRRAMDDDLELMLSLNDRRDVGGLRASLHRLSGAVGLVGARSLMEALRRVSVAQPEPEMSAIEALAKRARTLMIQLDKAIDLHRSNLQ
jgi:hypothetical protein